MFESVSVTDGRRVDEDEKPFPGVRRGRTFVAILGADIDCRLVRHLPLAEDAVEFASVVV